MRTKHFAALGCNVNIIYCQVLNLCTQYIKHSQEATVVATLKTQGPDLQKSYDYITTIPKLRLTYDGHIIYQTSYEERTANS